MKEKEFDINYLIGFKLKYVVFDSIMKGFSVNENSIISEYLSDQSISWTSSLTDTKLYIKGDMLFYSDRSMLINSLFIKEMESYYTYNKRKKHLENLGI